MHFPLHPETPSEGRSLVDLFGGPAARPRLEASQRRLQALAAAEGLPMGERTMTYNSRLAQELGAWAEAESMSEAGGGASAEALHDAMFRAYYVEGSNIARLDVLVEVAARAGFDPDQASRVLEERRYRDAIDADWQRAMAAGVTAIPTFEAGGRRVVGAQPYETLEQLVIAAGARRRATGP